MLTDDILALSVSFVKRLFVNNFIFVRLNISMHPLTNQVVLSVKQPSVYYQICCDKSVSLTAPTPNSGIRHYTAILYGMSAL